MTVVCTIEDCPWKITARAIGDSNIVQVHTFQNVHNHCLEDVALSRPLVRSTRASLVIDDVIRSTPEYQPRQICSIHVVIKARISETSETMLRLAFSLVRDVGALHCRPGGSEGNSSVPCPLAEHHTKDQPMRPTPVRQP
ncbi:hypothetical protein CK203_061170 [Vitis vinifera]|uniref:Transposase MuDR plant domain-containing protein n=1 Tax=Vitis vinifera TaxID=29760 RepID=A0A438GCA0_VITVI|nr:hypothetical protein CK203_061170 [Vitis vinifera]